MNSKIMLPLKIKPIINVPLNADDNIKDRINLGARFSFDIKTALVFREISMVKLIIISAQINFKDNPSIDKTRSVVRTSRLMIKFRAANSGFPSATSFRDIEAPIKHVNCANRRALTISKGMEN